MPNLRFAPVLRACLAPFVLMLVSSAYAQEKPDRTPISDEPWVWEPADPQPKVIYGTDDRVDLYQVTDAAMREWAASTCALVSASQLTDNPNDTFTLHTSAYLVSGLSPCT
ncbi:MAG: hypothetical protein HYZ00_08380, partial [Candidatus Hydrogenedentes bacterium]|nr:hypothetical protein [Candidatus Hydrogenedentota bacterium]